MGRNMGYMLDEKKVKKLIEIAYSNEKSMAWNYKRLHDKIKAEIIISTEMNIDSLIKKVRGNTFLYYCRFIFFVLFAVFAGFASISAMFAGHGIRALQTLMICAFFLYLAWACHYKFCYRHLYAEVLLHFKNFGKDFTCVGFDEREMILTSGLLSYLTLRTQGINNGKKT